MNEEGIQTRSELENSERMGLKIGGEIVVEEVDEVPVKQFRRRVGKGL